MDAPANSFVEDNKRKPEDLRHQVAAVLLDRSGPVTTDMVAIFPFSGAETLSPEYCRRVGSLIVQLLAFAVRDGRVDARGGFVADLHHIALERRLPVERLFAFAYLTERAALDELAVNETIGATSEAWPLVAQLVRRASFDMLASYVERIELEPSGAATTDRLTTLHSRPVMDVVLAKEVERAGRFGYPLSIILFDVDNLSSINKDHGYGVGDRILERLGILIRGFFRQHDWVARYSEDSMAVLLTGPDAAHANDLAERVRVTVDERMGFNDHLTDRPVSVTLSAAVINLKINPGDVIDPERLMTDVESAVGRAKREGRNRVEIIDGYSATPPPTAPKPKPQTPAA
jgi:diguanylate cyclase (GGDEF)-like protein